MGGAVIFSFRDDAGAVETIDVWTNPTGSYYKHREVYAKNPDFIREYIAECRKYDSVDVPLAPDGYGLTVIDFKGNHILTMQGYTSYDHFTGFGAYDSGIGKDTEVANFYDLCDDGRITLTERRWPEGADAPTVSEPVKVTDRQHGYALGKSWYDHQKQQWRGERVPYIDAHFAIDMTPFTYISFREDLAGAEAYYAKLKELGFELTDKDEASWAAWIAEQREREAEDEEEDEE